ncbi:MAG: hypothetical protein JWN53_2073 [Gemmatimonadetes bacterium]|nr:hypothetical protein [Gemmatimonadota bacterium]
MEDQPLLDAIEPDVMSRLAARKKEIDRGSSARPGIAAMLAVGSIPLAIAALTRDAYGAAPTAAIKAVLDFVLALEIFENEFYKAVLGTSSSPAQVSAFAPVRALVPATALATMRQIQKHEQAHVTFLTAAGATNGSATGGTALTAASFDFTGARGAGNGPFAGATSNLGFLLEVAQGLEDTSVRAYKGQAANLMSDPATLEAALRIHSVEARHAARIRRIRRLAIGGTSTTVRLSGTVRGGGSAAAGGTGSESASVIAAFEKIYGTGANSTTAPSEANTLQAGVTITGLANTTGFNVEAFGEAFDEPLDKADVVAIVQPFFIPTLT